MDKIGLLRCTRNYTYCILCSYILQCSHTSSLSICIDCTATLELVIVSASNDSAAAVMAVVEIRIIVNTEPRLNNLIIFSILVESFYYY